MTELRPGTKQILLSFDTHGDPRKNDTKSDCTYSITPGRPFLPLGLLFWGPTEETFVTLVRVGAMMEVDVAGSKIPARYFTTDRSLAELQRLADMGELHGAVKPRQVIQMSEASPGCCVSVSVRGPFESFCMWGLTYADGQPHRRAEIVDDEKGGWVATLSDVRLEKDVPSLIAKAPRAELAAQLLIGLQHPRHY